MRPSDSECQPQTLARQFVMAGYGSGDNRPRDEHGGIPYGNTTRTASGRNTAGTCPVDISPIRTGASRSPMPGRGTTAGVWAVVAQAHAVLALAAATAVGASGADHRAWADAAGTGFGSGRGDH